MPDIFADLKVRLAADGKSWTLLEPMDYHVHPRNGGEEIVVPQDFKTEFASVPWFLQWFISTWKKTARAAVIHDFLYSTEGQTKHAYTRARADAILLEVLGVMGHKRRWFAWFAVRAFGWKAWNKNAPEPGDT